MANHQNFYYWLKNVVSLQEGQDKDFFSIRDKDNNDITFYDDDKQILRRAFKRALPNIVIKKA